jgi:tripartite-type tricarboxylate transporter receptor subunit TctC
MPNRRMVLGHLAATLGATAGPLASRPARAQATAAWPARPVRLILPFPAGGGTDNSARMLAEAITRQTQQAAVVENRPGANGLIAAQAAAAAAPDGYTFFITSMSTQSVNPHVIKKLPYDPIKDFAPVARMTMSYLLLVVRNTDDQPRTYAELVARARASGRMNYGSGNTSSRVGAEVWKAKEKLDVAYVAYQGIPQGLNDLIGGQIDVMFPDLSPAVPLVKAGKLRALAVSSPERLPILPDVPTVIEVGLPEAALTTWSACYAPAGTPRPIIDRMAGIVRESLESKEVQDAQAKLGTKAAPSSPDELAEFTRSEFETWGRAIRMAGIEPE